MHQTSSPLARERSRGIDRVRETTAIWGLSTIDFGWFAETIGPKGVYTAISVGTVRLSLERVGPKGRRLNHTTEQKDTREMSTGAEKGSGRYSPEQVQAILERAISSRKGGDDLTGISYQELQETAVELDIDAADLDRAIMEYEASWEIEDARERWLVRRKEKFFEHLRSYLIVNAMLMGIALLSGSGFWFLWPLLGWGVGLAFDASEAFYPKQSDIEKGADRLLRKEERSRRKREKGKSGKSRSTWKGLPTRATMVPSPFHGTLSSIQNGRN